MAPRPSIRRRLLFGLIAAVVLLWGIALLFVYWAAENEVEEVYDAALAQEARVLAALLSHEAGEEAERAKYLQQLLAELGADALRRSPLLARLAAEYMQPGSKKDYLDLPSQQDAPGHPYESKIAFAVRYPDSRVMVSSPNMPAFDSFVLGFGTLREGADSWRVFGLTDSGSGLQVQVCEQTAVRRETVAYILWNSLWPMLPSLPLLGLIIWITVGNSLRPLYRVAEKVERRAPRSLQPISTDAVPSEVVPMVESLNRLFERVHQALENERRFTANAAHELRTPLAALKTQAQAAQLGADGGGHARFLEQIIDGVDRATHLLEQLLTLARVDARQDQALFQQQADIHAVTLAVLSVAGELALDKGIDLSMESESGPVWIRGDSASLEILVRNLVDNAIRYTPAGGAVSVGLEQDPAATRLTVSDTGPGIPPDQRQTLFKRFSRGEGVESPGIGLGLSIAAQIAAFHGAEIELQGVPERSGLVVSVLFPA